MAAPSPNPQFKSLFGATSKQGARFDTLDPPGGEPFRVYAFLAKADFDDDPAVQKWDVLFEVVRADWMDNAVFNRSVAIPAQLPKVPALLYHVQAADEKALLTALGLTSTDHLAEGSWYEMTLESGKGTVTGDLYNPDIDTVRGQAS